MDHYTQTQVDMKDAELANYYKHTMALQHSLNRSYESLALAQRQLMNVNELHKESFQVLKEYQEHCSYLKHRLQEMEEDNGAQEDTTLIPNRIAHRSRGNRFFVPETGGLVAT